MELPSKILEQIAHTTRPKIEKHMLIVMNKSTHEAHLSQPLQTNNKLFKKAVTFLTDNGLFNVTILNITFYFVKPITDGDGFPQKSIPPGAYKKESLNNEIKMNIFEEDHFTEANYPSTIKPNFSTRRSAIEISRQGLLLRFLPNDCIRDPLRFIATTLYEKYIQSPNPVDILSFDNFFLETDIAQGLIFKGKRSAMIHNFYYRCSSWLRIY